MKIKNKNYIQFIYCFFITISLILIFILFYLYTKNHKLTYFYIYYPYFYAILVLLFSISFIFFINTKAKINFFLFFVSCFFSLYFSEFLLFLFNKNFVGEINRNLDFNLKRKEIAKSLEISFDIRTKKELYLDLKKDNAKKISLAISTNEFFNIKNDLFPLSGGISNYLLIHCNESGYYTYFQSDRFGFNNHDSDWDNSKIDFLLVGDSYVHGACVDTMNGQGFSSNFKKITNKNVLNLGVGGSGLLSYYARIREYVMEKEISNMILFFNEGDMYMDLEKELKDYRLAKYLNIDYNQDLKIKQKETDLIINNLILSKLELENNKKIDFYNFFSFSKLQNVRFIVNKYFILYSNKNKMKEASETILKNIRILLKNSNLYLVCIPGVERYQQLNFSLIKTYKLNECSDISEIAKRLNYKVIDLDQELFKFKKDPESYYPFKLHGHFNSSGYEDVSKFIINNYF
jgi:hypothetical protein